MKKIKLREIQRGDKIMFVGEVVTVLNLWFYGNRVQLEIEWKDHSTCQISRKATATVDKLD